MEIGGESRFQGDKLMFFKGKKPAANQFSWFGWSAANDSPSASVIKLPQKERADGEKIQLSPGSSVVGLLLGTAVSAGDTVVANMFITSCSVSAATVRVILIRNDAGSEKKAIFKTLTKVPGERTKVSVGGKFGSSHASLRLEIKNVGESVAEIIVEQPQITAT